MADDRDQRLRRNATARRRLKSVSRTFLLLIGLTALAPFIVALGAIVDGFRRLRSRVPAMTLRLLAFAWLFLAIEAVGIIWMGLSWIRSGFGRNRDGLVAATWPIQRWWGRTLLRSVRVLFGLRFEVVGMEAARPGPIIAMFRHASIVDNLLPVFLLTDQLRLELRWILKKELLTLPSLDIAGHRLPNHFVDRSGIDPRTELAHIRSLASDLGEDEGVLIFPEGTRFSEQKRRRALDRLAEEDPELHELAVHMRHVLPPRLGGPLTLMESGADLLVVAHAGLDGFSSIRQIWTGSMVGRTVSVEAWRIPAGELPTSPAERARWLFERWLEVDEWIEDRLMRDQAS